MNFRSLQWWWCEAGCSRWQHSWCEFRSCGSVLRWNLGNCVRWPMGSHCCRSSVQSSRILPIQWVMQCILCYRVYVVQWDHLQCKVLILQLRWIKNSSPK